ncbi:MAG: M6 family metalloprotease domain-containing protein [Bacteroidales bacterium]
MKKSFYYFLTITICFQLFLLTNTALAVIAYPYPIEFKQPDGSKITILLKGDEKVRWAETSDGYAILYNQFGTYEYAVLDSKNNLIPSGIQARNLANRSTADNVYLGNIPKYLHYSTEQVQLMKSAWSVYQSESQNTFPTSGNRSLVCILIGFTDLAFAKTQTDFNNLFNQINYTASGATGSVKDFYLENSYNQLNLTVTVAGPFTAANNQAYYGANTGSQGTDIRPRELVAEAVNLANPTVNFANFDNDNDGTVDGVYVIYAGFGEEAGGGTNCIWAHAWNLATTLTLDGKTISKYSCSPELSGNSGTSITNIGVICHEFGHVLGAPDYYDIDYATGGQYDGTGNWDIMAGGSWNNGGKTPAHHNAYTKTMVYAWASPTLLSSASQITLSNAAENSNSYYRYNTTTTDEYFLIENRQQLKFDASIPGHGMIIYHVDGSYISTASGINAASHQGMYPVCANATGNPPTTYGTINGGGCPFPGTGAKTSFTDLTTPNSKSWATVNTAKPITLITENITNKTVSFSFMGGVACTPPSTQATSFIASGNSTNALTTSWVRGNGNAVIVIAKAGSAVNADPVAGISYTANAVFGNGTQIGTGNYVVYDGSGTTVNLSALSPNTTYYYAVYEYNTTGLCYKTPALIGNATTTAAQSNGCDTLTNIVATDLLTVYTFGTGQWGYWTGHNSYGISEFAEYYSGILTPNITGLEVYVYKAFSGGTGGNHKVTFNVYAGGGTTPGAILASKDVAISLLTPNALNYIHFDTPVGFSGSNIYVGYQIYTNVPADTFCVVQTQTRADLTSSGFMKYNNIWSSYPSISTNTVYSSIYISPILCSSCTPPTTQATSFTSSAIANTTMTTGWTRGNGNSVLVVARQGSAVNTDPLNGSIYTANAAFGSGTQLGSGNYVVYSGTGTSVNLTALTSGTTYYYAIYEYNTIGNCYKTPALTGNTSTTGTPPCIICVSSGDLSYNTSITLTSFNTINNVTAKTAGYNDYTALSTTVNKGSIYNLTVNLNTDGAYTVSAMAWIDWNQNCNFNDAGETYILGTANNVSNGATTLSPLGITIPTTALTGNTKMRISAKYGSTAAAACDTAYDGEVEDYTINVAPASCTPPTTQASGFTSSAITATTMTTGWTRGNGNSVLVVARQGSAVNADPLNGTAYTANAAFGSGTQIGTGNYVIYSGTGTTVNITALTAASTYYYAVYEYATTGNCYKTPALSGNATTICTPVAITTQPLASQSGCAPSNSISLTVIANTGSFPITYQWQYNNAGTWANIVNATPTGAIYTNGATASMSVSGITTIATHQYRCYLSNCGGVNTATSTTASIIVNAIPSVNAITAQTICSGGSTTLVTPISTPTGATFAWTANASSGISGQTISGTATIPVQTLSTTAISAGTVSYTITPTLNSCIGNATIFVVNVNPKPQISNQTTSTSGGSAFTVSPTGVPAGTTYTWTAPTYTGGVTGGSAQATPQTSISQTLTIPSGSGTATYTVTPSSGSCVGNTFTVSVSVIYICTPVAITSQPVSSQTSCAPSSSVTLTVTANTGSTPITYQWQYFNGSSWVNVVNGIPSGASYTNGATASMSVSGITSVATHQYHCFLSNCGGVNTVTSTTSSLIITTVPSIAGTISGSTIVCQNQMNSTYTVPLLTDATSYTWTLPSGANGASTTNGINVNYSNTAVSGNITVKGHNSCGDGNPSSLAITVNSLPLAAGSISGLTSLCQGQNNIIYTVAPITNASSYSWTLPSGASGSSLTDSITVNYSNLAVSGNIVVKGHNNCGDGITASLPVILNPLPLAAGAITGSSSVCQSQNNISYSVALITNANTYFWTLPNGATASGSSNSIIVNYSSLATSGNITVKGQNACGDGISSIKAITVNAIPATPVITLNGNTFTSNASSGNQWYNLSNGLLSGATANTYHPLQIGNYFTIVTLNNCISDSSNIIYFDNTGINENNSNLFNFNVLPNPFSEKATIEYTLNESEYVELSLIDITGKVLMKLINEKQNKGKQTITIDAAQLNAGIYFYKLKIGNLQQKGKLIHY